MDDSQYWSYVGDCVEETSCVRPGVRRFLETQADAGQSDLDAAELVVGELVANAVRHGAPPFGVCIDWHDDPPMLCVVDRGRGMRPVYPAPDFDSESGRGLLLVRALAGEVVVDSSSPGRDGTRVVVALPVHRGPPRAA
ncbi:MAG: ATP-binding protein [Candidatus Eremiobacteraeota bacterium]|nr:ATP-binding protein [Candidatus Eremiobacteraeota bacterium]